MILYTSAVDAILREHMDIGDRDTRHAVAITLESNQNQLLSALTSKLYDKIVEKADKIDFSSISRSRGDITKIENYNSLMECIDIMRNIVVEYKQDTAPIDTVSNAVENIKSRTNVFKKAFTLDAKLPVMVYNSIGLSIVSSISFLIATCIEYIKNPQSNTFQMALDTVAYTKAKDNLMFESLILFNDSCKCGELDETFNTILKQNRINKECAEVEVKPDSPFLTSDEIESEKDVVIHDDKENIKEAGALTYQITRAFIAMTKWIIPFIRKIVYQFYFSKQKISDFFAVQADLLQMNMYNVQYNESLSDEEKKKIMDKQLKIADKFRKYSNKFNIDNTTARKAAKNAIDDDNKKCTAKDIGYDSDQENYDDVTVGSVLF